MNRRIEGAFREYGHLLEAINDLHESGYESKQLLVVTRNDSDSGLTEKTGVEVVVTRGESLWDKIVSFFTVELDGDDDENEPEDEEDIFEKFGIDEETYERFEESLENGEYLLLVDTAPPADPEHADFMVRDGIIKEEENAKLAARPDWTDADVADGDVPKHSRNAETEGVSEMTEEFKHGEMEPDKTEITESEQPALEDEITGEPIEADTQAGDVTEGDEEVVLDELQHDEVEFPDVDKVSTDPFGGETETKKE